MGQYVYGIIGAAAVIGVMESILPKGGKTKQYMKLITALCLLCLVIKPVGSFLDALPDLLAEGFEELSEGTAARDEYEAILAGEIEEAVRDQLCGAITGELSTRFSVSNCEVGVALSREDGALTVRRVVITLMGKDIFKNPYEIEEYFGALLDCECIVAVG